jgi:hypothetical protein
MKSLVRFATLSPVLLLALTSCSLPVDTPDNSVGESAGAVALVDNAAVERAYTAVYASDYLVPGVALPSGLGFHQITMSWFRTAPEAGGTCQIDPNTCGLNEFGDRTICTKMAVAGSDMQLTLFAEKPGYEAYAIGARPYDSTGDYAAMPLRLVTIAAQGKEPAQVRLLVLNTDETIARIIELR